MILLHRITPFAVFLLCLLGFGILIFSPFTSFVLALLCFAAALFALARLLLFDIRHTGFWVFFGLPLFVLCSAVAFFLLLESDTAKWVIAIFVPLVMAVYAENLFAFYHVPSAYQAYSLEYTSLTLSLSSLFFFACSVSLAQFFLELPVWSGALFMAIICSLLTFIVLWTSKVAFLVGRAYGFSAAILFFELFAAVSFLPTSYTVNAAVCTVFFAMFLWYARADVLDAWSSKHARLIMGGGAFLIAVILGTAVWI